MSFVMCLKHQKQAYGVECVGCQMAKIQAELAKAKTEIESLKLKMQIHAGDICSANNEADRFIAANNDLKDENKRLRDKIRYKQQWQKCPRCNKTFATDC